MTITYAGIGSRETFLKGVNIMEKVTYNQITDNKYLGIITILDYETSIRKCLMDIFICTQNRLERKVIIDLALKSGINEYRFVVCNITEEGTVLWKSSTYITPCNNIVQLANSFIRQRSDILLNSMLPSTTKKILLA